MADAMTAQEVAAWLSLSDLADYADYVRNRTTAYHAVSSSKPLPASLPSTLILCHANFP